MIHNDYKLILISDLKKTKQILWFVQCHLKRHLVTYTVQLNGTFILQTRTEACMIACPIQIKVDSRVQLFKIIVS